MQSRKNFEIYDFCFLMLLVVLIVVFTLGGCIASKQFSNQPVVENLNKNDYIGDIDEIRK